MATIRAYLVDIKYHIEDNVLVHLFCRDEQGRLIIIHDYYRPNFFIYPKKNIDLIHLRAKIARLKFDERNFVTSTALVRKKINCQEDNFIQVFASRPESIAMIRNTIKEWDDIINYFEDDISLSRRYLLENKITPFSIFEAEVVEHKDEGIYKLVKYINRDISFAEPKVMSISAAYEEDNSGSKAISAICCSQESNDIIITWKKDINAAEVRKVNSEEDILIQLKQIMQTTKPDMLLFEDKDFKLSDLYARFKKYKIPMRINFDNSEPYYSHLTRKLRTIGINEIFIKTIMDNFINFSLAEESLENTYNTISGIVNISAIAKEDNEDTHLINLIHKKARLNYMLFSSIYNNLTELFKLIGLRSTDLLNFSLISVIEWILIRQCIDTNQIVLSKHDAREEYKERRRVIYHPVIDPVPGIYKDVAKIDLNPLYPELIIKNNLSPETLICDIEERKKVGQGILPATLSDIIARIERIEIALEKTQNENLERRRNILVRICSFFYEYLNVPYSRWYSYELLETINSFAKETINEMIKETNKENSVVFSDYQDLYIEMKEDKKEYLKKIQDQFPETVRMTIKDSYKRGFFLPREETRYMKKRFALLNDKSIVESSYILRHSHPDFVTDTIKELMKMILINQTKTDIIKYLRERIAILTDKKIPKPEQVIRHKLIKNSNEYQEKTIQYNIIKKLKAQGHEVKRYERIHYIIIEGDDAISKRARIPGEVKADEYDIFHYLNRIFIPGIEDIIGLKGITAEELLEPEDQSQLNKFIS